MKNCVRPDGMFDRVCLLELVMYFIILSTASALCKADKKDIESAGQAADALQPLAGDAGSILFAAGIIAVGFLAVPVMTTGAAYDLCQVLGWKHGLHAKTGFSTPPLLLLIMLMTNNRVIMGDRVNSRWVNALGWTTTAAVFAATLALVCTWFM